MPTIPNQEVFNIGPSVGQLPGPEVDEFFKKNCELLLVDMFVKYLMIFVSQSQIREIHFVFICGMVLFRYLFTSDGTFGQQKIDADFFDSKSLTFVTNKPGISNSDDIKMTRH